jgi:hypothetical protein
MVLSMGLLTGCNEVTEEVTAVSLTPKLYAEGTVDFEESTKGIYSGDPDIVSKMVNNTYYVYHNEYFYPVTYDWTNYESLSPLDKPDPSRIAVFDSTTCINIPTLFEGDKLFYFSTTGVVDYTILERFKDLGWSIGIGYVETSLTGNNVFFEPGENFEEGIANGVILTNEIKNIYEFIANEEKESDGQFMLDKIGGVKITEDNVKDNIVVGLEKGKAYDVEIYSGTEYMYYQMSATVQYLQSFETYGVAEFNPMQDYLYEVILPDYLLTGYYDVGGSGFMRLVKDTKYSDETNYNEELLIGRIPEDDEIGFNMDALTEEEKEEILEKRRKAAGMYSTCEALNSFEAKDETCFGWVDEEALEEEEFIEEEDLPMDEFYEASTTRTSIWMPSGKRITISIITSETTGFIYLESVDGTQRKIPYDRLLGGYVLSNIDGDNAKYDIVVKGLYKDYKVKLTNAESYKGQDAGLNIDVEESTE